MRVKQCASAAQAVVPGVCLVLLYAAPAAAGRMLTQTSSVCGGHNQPACQANPSEHEYPYCTEPGTYAMYSAWGVPMERVTEVEGWCWRIDPQCGTAAGKPCCPSSYHKSIDPAGGGPRVADGCNGNDNDALANPRGALYCERNPSDPATIKADENAILGYQAGTCVANAPGCGETGKPCCYSAGSCCSSFTCFSESDEYDAYAEPKPVCKPKVAGASGR